MNETELLNLQNTTGVHKNELTDEPTTTRVSSQDIANYGSAAGSLLGGIGNLINSVRKNPNGSNPTSDPNLSSSTGNGRPSPAKAAVPVWVWVAAAVVVLGGVLFLILKNKQ